jgi:hypothetical protein
MKEAPSRPAVTGRLWTYVRDDQPFGGSDPPAAAFFYSHDRGGEHPEQHLASYAGLMQADAYAGFNRLYEAGRKPGPIVEAACWAHARRKFFDLARLNKTPIAIEAVERIDALFAIERDNRVAGPFRLLLLIAAVVALGTGFILFRRYERDLEQRAEAAIPGPWPRPHF